MSALKKKSKSLLMHFGMTNLSILLRTFSPVARMKCWRLGFSLGVCSDLYVSMLMYDIDISTKCVISVIRLSLGEDVVMMVKLSIRLCFDIFDIRYIVRVTPLHILKKNWYFWQHTLPACIPRLELRLLISPCLSPFLTTSNVDVHLPWWRSTDWNVIESASRWQWIINC